MNLAHQPGSTVITRPAKSSSRVVAIRATLLPRDEAEMFIEVWWQRLSKLPGWLQAQILAMPAGCEAQDFTREVMLEVWPS